MKQTCIQRFPYPRTPVTEFNWEMGLASERASEHSVGQCCISSFRSQCTTCVGDDDDEFALLDAHDVPTLARGREGVLWGEIQ